MVCCGIFFILALLLFVLNTVLFSFIVVAPIPQFGVSIFLWVVMIFFLIFALVVICTTPACFLRKSDVDESVSDYREYYKQNRAANFITRFCCCCGCLIVFFLSIAVVIYVVHLQTNNYSGLQTLSLGAYSNGTQKVFSRFPGATTVVIAYSSDNVTWDNSSLLLPTADTDWVTFVSLPLLPGTLYSIHPIVDDAIHEPCAFNYKTPSLNPTSVQFSFGSCIFPSWWRGLPGFTAIANLNPDFLLFIGDFIYPDVVTPLNPNVDQYRAHYREVLSDPHVFKAFKQFPTFFMFDDHETKNDNTPTNDPLAWNNGMLTWKEYLGNGNPPPYRPGVDYYTITAGPGSFFMLDTRTFRSSNDTTTATILGSQQLADLKTWLTTTTSTFKFIVSTVTVSQNDYGWGSAFAVERTDLLDFIKTSNINGVTFLSGDAHHFAVYELSPGIYEFTVSPIDAYGSRSIPASEPDTVLVSKTVWGDHYAALVKIDNSGTPSMRLTVQESENGYGKPLYDQAFTLGPTGFTPS